ncbi:methylated-DNA--[protein]-cysteine S-methyltransferase [Candidatus Azambacteria bacterium]|nr:methylated-DNA--[protein]-cysteine S-methyltransferase [Candidatus Azambacteria bacterium]
METQKERSAGIIFFRQEKGKMLFLLLKSRYGDWGFSKGEREPSEQKIQAAVREAKEETHIENFFIVPGFIVHYKYSFLRNHHLVQETVTLFAARTGITRVTLSQEHVASCWLPYRETLQKLTFENARTALRRLHFYLAHAKPALIKQKKFYRALARVPKGKVTTYRAIARALGISPRMAGSMLALHYNHNVPCHRVVFSDGRMGGYNRGISRKIALLRKEGVRLRRKKNVYYVDQARII